MRFLVTLFALISACGAVAPLAASTWDSFMVLTTDYATYGSVGEVQRDDPWVVTADVTTVGADAVGRWHAGDYYVVDRGGDNLQILDGDLTTLDQFTLGTGRNPNDIAFADDGTAYVSCYDATEFLKVDLATGAVLNTWSTAAFADADGMPETGWMERLGNLVAVSCQRIDRNLYWGPADYSTLLIFDLDAQDWVDHDQATPGVQPLMLVGTNPSPQMHPVGDGQSLWVATTGFFAVLDGGIEVVDVLAGTTSGFQVTEAQLGGDLLDFVIAAPDLGYAVIAVVTPEGMVTHLVSFDPRDGSGVTTVAAAADWDYVDVDFDGVDQIYMCDRTIGAAGVRVFDAASGAELTSTPLATGRAPFMVVLPVDGATDVESVLPAAPSVSLDPPFPNPANPRCTVSYRLPAGAEGRLSVLDLRGRLLREARVVGDGEGRGAWTWDGVDHRGRQVASGAYRVALEAGGERTMRPFSLVR